MSEPSTSTSKLKEWLDNLQQESWQLELIVSGFVIFLLVGVYEPIQDLEQQVGHLTLGSFEMSLLFFPLIVLEGAWLILLINLLIHVGLRGLWISTIGLRYVSQDIDFEALRFTSRFDTFLRKRAGSFDQYIESLEKLCSAIFAFTFLLVFMVISLGVFIGILLIFLLSLQWLLGMSDQDFAPISQVLNLIFLFTGLLYFIDFIGLGWLKRIKWVGRWYYPIYRLMGFMTAARLYRPLYYNLIDNRFGRRLGFLLVPYFLLLMFASSIRLVTDTYMPRDSSPETIRTDFYDDEHQKPNFESNPSIPSRYVDNGFVSVFIPYAPVQDDKALEELCPGLGAAQATGVRIYGVIKLNSIYERDVKSDSLLLCFSQQHRIYINDSLMAEPDFYFYDHQSREDQGIQTLLDVAYLPRGRHLLRVESYRAIRRINGRTTDPEWQEALQIPFWITDN